MRDGKSRKLLRDVSVKTRDGAWLLLVYQLPVASSAARIRVWLKLEDLGALEIKKSVYLLPKSHQALSEMKIIKSEIIASKGQANVFAADSLDSVSRDEAVTSFREARRRDYLSLRSDSVWMLHLWKASPRDPTKKSRERILRLLRKRFSRIEAIDFFRASGREGTAVALAALGRFLAKL